MGASGATRRPMGAEETDKLLMQPWPGQSRSPSPLSACPSLLLHFLLNIPRPASEGRIGGSKGGEGMVNDNNAVGDQTVTLPSPDWDRQYRAKIKLRITKLQLIQV